MNHRWKLLNIGSLILALLSFSENALACDCSLTSPPCEAYWKAEAVFIGTPKELSWIEYEDKLPELVIKRKKAVFSFSVDQAFRGVNGAQVSVLTGIGRGDCGYGFKIGEQYLVYAIRDPKKKEMLYTGICTRTRPVRNAGDDDEGRYEMRRIPPGNYKLSVYYNGPPGELLKSFPLFYYPGVLSAEQAGVIVVGESAKVEDVDFRLPIPPKRTIEGVVLWPDGRPAPKAQLICYMHGGRMRPPIKTDEQGHFSFTIYEGVDAFLVAEIEIEKGKWMRGELKAAEKGDLLGVRLILAPRKDN